MLQILDGVQHVPRERVQNLVGKQIVNVPVSKIQEEIVELIAGEVVCNARTGVRRQHGWTCIFRYHRSRRRLGDSAGVVSASAFFFSLESVWESPLPHARVGVF